MSGGAVAKLWRATRMESQILRLLSPSSLGPHVILTSASLVGSGSSIFWPESSIHFIKEKKNTCIYLSVQGHSFGMWDFQSSLRMWDLQLWCVNSWLRLVSWPGIEPGPSALGAWSLRHWTTREVPLLFPYFPQHQIRLPKLWVCIPFYPKPLPSTIDLWIPRT